MQSQMLPVHQFEFTGAATVYQAWYSTSVTIVLIIAFCAGLFYFGSRKTWFETRLRHCFLAWLIGSAAALAASHHLYFSEFIGITIRGDSLHLIFADQPERDLTISKSKIVNVLYAPSGRNYHGCYVRLELRNGDNFRSASKVMPDPECKRLRSEIHAYIADER